MSTYLLSFYFLEVKEVKDEKNRIMYDSVCNNCYIYNDRAGNANISTRSIFSAAA